MLEEDLQQKGKELVRFIITVEPQLLKRQAMAGTR